MEGPWPELLRRLSVTILLSLCLCHTGWAASAETCAEKATMPSQLRTSSCQMARAITVGLADSPTFRRLVERIADLKGIVYVDGKYIVQPVTNRVLYGTLQHRVVKAADYRLLHITVAPGRESMHVALLAHELQHAVEVLESGETTDAGVTRLFDRIGSEAEAWAFETAAAVKTQQTVAGELAASHR